MDSCSTSPEGRPSADGNEGEMGAQSREKVNIVQKGGRCTGGWKAAIRASDPQSPPVTCIPGGLRGGTRLGSLIYKVTFNVVP